MPAKRKNSRPPREPNQKKQIKPKHRSRRGVPETNYGEIKQISSYSLTPTASINFKELGKELKISVSELLERVARLGPELKTVLERVNQLDNPCPIQSQLPDESES